MKTTVIQKPHARMAYLAGLLLLFIFLYSYGFDKKLDLNGDNCDYYMLASSIVEGHGYSNVGNPAMTPASHFPPGYPVLMAPVRAFTDSIVPQKMLNGLFLLGSVLLLFVWMRKTDKAPALAFVAAASILFNHLILRYSTIMMSEMSFLFFSVLCLWLLSNTKEKYPFWKIPSFYFLILAASYAFHIRTQGITLIVALIVFFLFQKQWKQCLAFVFGFVLCSLPWIIRNKALGLSGNRYLEQMVAANIWRPEEGTISFTQMIERGFFTLKMLVTKALPNSVFPFMKVDYEAATSFAEWIAGLVLIALIIVGFLRFRKYSSFLIAYSVAVFGIICTWSAPSANRYLVTLLPFLQVGLIVGIHFILCFIGEKTKTYKNVSPWILIFLFLFSFEHIKLNHRMAEQDFPPNYKNYFRIAEQFKEHGVKDQIVCSRKPSLFYVISHTFVCNYSYTKDSEALIDHLVKSKVDYVVLEQLGYASTFNYLYPAIQSHQDLFQVVLHLPNPDTYLFRFDRRKAENRGTQKE